MLCDLPLGVMQGRLLPKYKGRYQAHPAGYWADEFPIAAALGLELIEFILDFEDAEENPLLRPGGIGEIRAAASASGVGVRSICADYFMEAPLHGPDQRTAETSIEVFSRLLDTAHELGVTDIVLPCVDQSSLRHPDDRRRLVERLGPLTARAETLGINIALETDLAPAPFADLLDGIGSPQVSVNYDIGNSAALGHDPNEEFAAYGERITDIHIKDRTLGGGSVMLGEGAARFERVFELARQCGFSGFYILQAYRDEGGPEILRRQMAWLFGALGEASGGARGDI